MVQMVRTRTRAWPATPNTHRPVIPIIGLDYFFLTSAGVVLQEELKMDDVQLSEARSRGEVAKCPVVPVSYTQLTLPTTHLV